SGDFPFYGKLETEPPGAALDFRKGGALLEEALLIQYGAQVGDSVRLGELTTPIVGKLKKVPGETVGMATTAPRVYLPMADLERTGLLRRQGSMARYKVYFRFAPDTDVSRLVERIRPELDRYRIAHSTVETRKRDLGRSIDGLYNFLNLAGFI